MIKLACGSLLAIICVGSLRSQDSGGDGSSGGQYSVGRSAIRSAPPANGQGNTQGDGTAQGVCADEHHEHPELGPQWPPGCNGSCTAMSAVPGAPDVIEPEVQSGQGCEDCGDTPAPARAVSSGYSARGVSNAAFPQNRVNNSSFSPGYYSQFDSQLDIFSSSGGDSVAFFDAFAGLVYLYVDGLDGDVSDGVFHDMRNGHSRSLELLDSSQSVVLGISGATSARVTHWDGSTESFEIIDLNPDPAAEELAARLTSRTDLAGETLSVTYNSFTQSEIELSPSLQWQIDTVTDATGSQLDFTYDTVQHAGRWAVTSITRDDGATASFQYASDLLTAVNMPGGLQTTYVHEQDTSAQTATIRVLEAAQAYRYGGREVTYHLTNDYMTLDDAGRTEVINQPSGVHRMVVNSGSDVEWIIIPNEDPAIDQDFYALGGQVAKMQAGDASYEFMAWWNFTNQSSSDPYATEFEGVVGESSYLVGGAVATTTVGQIRNGQWPGFIDQTGHEMALQYDASGGITEVTYTADSSAEKYGYDTNLQVVRAVTRTGDVTLNTYDAQGHLLSIATGLVEQNGTDVQTASYAVETREYYPVGHVNEGQPLAKMTALYDPAEPTLERTDYEYDSKNRVTKIIGPADVVAGTRPETSFTYTLSGQTASVADPQGRLTTYAYDSAGRKVQTTYPDGSTEQSLYGTGYYAAKVVKAKDRSNTVTTYAYGGTGNVAQKVAGAAIDANILDGNPDDIIVTDPAAKTTTSYTYIAGGENLPTQVLQNGTKTEIVYNYQNDVIETKQHPQSGIVLSSKKAYINNLLFYDEDPYGRRKYYGYRASDGALIRTVTYTVPGVALVDFSSVWSLTRDASPNASYVIHDAIRDNDGNLTQVIDGRGVETRYEYDAQGRETKKTEAWGTTLAAITETDYDVAGNVIEVRSPRFFDSSDLEGSAKARETWQYDGRNQVVSHTEAAGSSIAATESFTYDLAGRETSRTDFNGKIWATIDDSCCGKSTASKNPLGHGSIRNRDPAGRVVHAATVTDIDAHILDMMSPVDAKTLSETTTRYDSLGRAVATTVWLSPLGAVDPLAPPIAGLDSIASSAGLTTQYFYDDNLTDGAGLDSTSGATFTKMAGGSGTSAVSVSNALLKLAALPASGGAEITFSSTAPGRAAVVISPSDEISFTISDAAGRTVMAGKLDNYSGTANTLLTWSCTRHDITSELAGFGTVLETQSIDALGKIRRSLTDAAGRTLRSIDSLGKATAFTYDPAGNQLSVLDPNGVGQTCVYDSLGRDISCTDTASVTTLSTYDAAGNKIASTDGKNNTTTYAFDARGRQVSQTDRISGVTAFAYTATGQLASLTDAENQVTSYLYDDAGNKLEEVYPDHVTSSSIGDAGYGKILFSYDAAGRTLVRTDQQGDTCTYAYDLAGRLGSRAYSGHATGPLVSVTDTDTFTYDASGRMLTAISGRYSNTVSYTYDSAGRKATESLTIAGQTYTSATEYDAADRVSKLTYPDASEVIRTYNERGQLATLAVGSTTIDTRTYDDGGRMTASSYNNGVTESRAYNADNTLASISFSGAAIGDLTYGWDANKNKTSEAIGGAMSGYGFTVGTSGYDDEDRLINWQRADTNLDQSWNLSLVGDWNSITENTNQQARTHGPTHEMLTAASQSVTHDAKGNMTLIPAVLRPAADPLKMKWDFENKLIAADIDNDSTDDIFYKFDALGRRVGRDDGTADVVYFQDGQQTIADYPAGTVAASPTYTYVYASYIDEPVMRGGSGGLRYFHRNQQYSITALTDGGGSIVERYAYTAYGQVTFADASGTVQTSSSSNNRYTYSGREWDAGLSLYHYRARMYDAVAGRFVSRDPIAYEGSEWSLYCYVEGSPLALLDPYGLEPIGHHVVPQSVFRGATQTVRDIFDAPNARMHHPCYNTHNGRSQNGVSHDRYIRAVRAEMENFLGGRPISEMTPEEARRFLARIRSSPPGSLIGRFNRGIQDEIRRAAREAVERAKREAAEKGLLKCCKKGAGFCVRKFPVCAVVFFCYDTTQGGVGHACNELAWPVSEFWTD